MKTAFTFSVVSLLATMFVPAQATMADCPLGHTHIGVNPTWRPDWSAPGDASAAVDPDPTDDNQLWLFSIPPVHAVAPTPGWPEWGDPSESPFLQLVQETDSFGNAITKPGDASKSLYVCRFMYGLDGYGDDDGLQHLDGWHSAHGPQGAWDLASVDQATTPGWDIGLKRENTSLADESDFFMLRPDESVVLGDDGDTYKFSDYGEMMWLEDKNAWGIHSHMGFYFWLDDPQAGDVVSATFTAYDDGGVYAASDPFTFSFAVPEPGTLGLLALAAATIGVRRRRS